MDLFKLPLNFTYQEVLPFLGMNKTPSPQEEKLIGHYLIKIKQLAQPIGTWKTFTVKTRETEKIHLELAPLQLVGVSTSEHFKTCAYITLLAATLGAEIDQLLSRLSSENPAHAVVADAVASTAIEFFTKQLDFYLSQQIRHKGFFPTARFSPGYGDWPLSWQKEFLLSVAGGKIGLSATSYFVLEPSKSVTAALGWSEIPVERSYNSPTTTMDNPLEESGKPCRSEQTCRYCQLASSCPDRLL